MQCTKLFGLSGSCTRTQMFWCLYSSPSSSSSLQQLVRLVIESGFSSLIICFFAQFCSSRQSRLHYRQWQWEVYFTLQSDLENWLPVWLHCRGGAQWLCNITPMIRCQGLIITISNTVRWSKICTRKTSLMNRLTSQSVSRTTVLAYLLFIFSISVIKAILIVKVVIKWLL